MTKYGANTLTLSSSNGFTGNTRVASGTLRITNAAALSASTLDLNAADQGNLNFAASSTAYTLGGLAGTRNLSMGTSSLIVGGNSFDTLFSGTFVTSGGLTKVGSGVLTLTGNNSYTGGTLLAAGVLEAGSPNALGPSGTISFQGGTLRFAAASSSTDFSTRFSQAPNQAYRIDTNDNTVSIATPLTSLNGSLTKTGAGTLVLTANNSYTGGTTVSDGVLQIGNGGTAGWIPGNVINNATLAFSRSDDVVFSGLLSGSGSVSQIGPGVLSLTGTNTYSGETRLANGTIELASSSATGSTGVISFTGGTLRYTAASSSQDLSGRFSSAPGQQYRIDTGENSVPCATSLTGSSSSLRKLGTGTLILTGSTTFDSGVEVVAGTLQIGDGGTEGNLVGNVYNDGTLLFNRSDSIAFTGTISGSGAFQKIGSGTVTLASRNTFRGETSIGAGNLAITNSYALAGSTLNLKSIDSGTLELGTMATGSCFLGGLTGSRNLNIGRCALLIGGNGLTTSFDGVVSGSGSLSKAGNGVLLMSNTSTYTGPTTVAAGELALNGRLLATSSVGVLAGATLSGSGRVDAPTTIARAATISPGASPGTLSFSSGLTFEAGGNYNWQLFNPNGSAGTANGWDLISVGGTFTINATPTSPFRINLWTLAATGPDVSGAAVGFDPAQSYSWKLLSTTGSISGFSSDKFTVNTAATNGTDGFANPLLGGVFRVSASATDLLLDYVPSLPPPALTINIASGTVTQLNAGYPVLTGNTPIEKAGKGTLVLDATNTSSAPMMIREGSVLLTNAAAFASGTVTALEGGTLTLSCALKATISGLAPNAGGAIDVGSGSITVSHQLTATELVTALVEGRGDGTWSGSSGIISSAAATAIAAAAPRAVGWIDNGDGSKSFAYSAPGDTNIDWNVDILDAANFLTAGRFDTGTVATWFEGDFSYDGIVDVLDAADFFNTGLFDNGYYNSMPDQLDLLRHGTAVVPEPSSITIITLGFFLAVLHNQRAGYRRIRP